ncbi:hypothetical protein IQ266_04550 [filamentous cyanobacterium LEGE 11480]|uniref:C2 domain-containing protein n=1 Tax=Romeriopsis navalis LEGE 11480 TaxID=2777977 RepID=A0A928VI52_9CYAN|nr:C2 domain-containing protein [Romeriopsis navalis]MBE9029031.1 hypothetical protein [Romeriopsis navalis LEGE 11480]
MKYPLAQIGLVSLTCLSSFMMPLTASAQTPTGKQTGTVTLTVLKAKALSKFDRSIPFSKKGRPDFYVLTKVNTQRGHTVSLKRNNQNNPTFNHKLTSRIPENNLVEYTIRLKESDAGRDDTADINPVRRRNNLEVIYDANARAVFMPNGRRLGRLGETITVQGDSKSRRASITFKLELNTR